MSRSIKKGPYVQEVLLKRVIAMNEAGEKKVLKTWSRSSTINCTACRLWSQYPQLPRRSGQNNMCRPKASASRL